MDRSFGGQPESEPKDFLKEAATEHPLSGRVIKEGQAGLVLFAPSRGGTLFRSQKA